MGQGHLFQKNFRQNIGMFERLCTQTYVVPEKPSEASRLCSMQLSSRRACVRCHQILLPLLTMQTELLSWFAVFLR